MSSGLHDSRAELAALQNDFAATFEALKEAVALSPNTLRRQINLTAQAWAHDDHKTALQALRRCWEVGRHATLFDPESLWQQASILAQFTCSAQHTEFSDEIEQMCNAKSAVRISTQPRSALSLPCKPSSFLTSGL